MTTIQIIIEALKQEAADCAKAAADPKCNHNVQLQFFWQKQHLTSLAAKLEKVASEHPDTP